MGFTLIELMIVIAIIGILAAIAIPQFAAYRARSHNASANSDIRNAMTTQEAYYVDNETYATSVAQLTDSTYGLVLSSGVEDIFTVASASDSSYEMRCWNTNAGDRAVTFWVSTSDSNDIQKEIP